MARTVYYLKLAIKGIQKYIFSTGKLKEMIGGSEIINFIADKNFYDPLLKSQNLEEDGDISGAPGKYIVAQANAGALCLILPSAEAARDFMTAAFRQILAEFPGLPVYGAMLPFKWSDDNCGREVYAQARKAAENMITAQRNASPIPQGSALLPVLRGAKPDGLPAVEQDGSNFISLPSRARCNPAMLERSQKRLRELVEEPCVLEGLNLIWKNDLEEMLCGEGGKVALICMDGNDLGKLFRAKLEEASHMSLCQSIKAMKELSRKVKECNEAAFSYACQRIAAYEAVHQKHPGIDLVMPLRPLVMGGDDITIIARADIALPFVEMFARKFNELGKADKFSLGIGMVIMDSGYPFAKAFPLAESLQDSAKNLTRDQLPGKRPSSLDYLVLTEDVENNVELVRQRLFTTPQGELLTGKPFILKDNEFLRFLRHGNEVLTDLPRSQIRQAWTVCRKGPAAVRKIWTNLRENIARDLGGRDGKLMSATEFEEIFPDNSFFSKDKSGKYYTRLGDYLELERLLPIASEARAALLKVLREDSENV